MSGRGWGCNKPRRDGIKLRRRLSGRSRSETVGMGEGLRGLLGECTLSEGRWEVVCGQGLVAS